MSQDASATSDGVISVIAKKSNALRTYVRTHESVRTCVRYVCVALVVVITHVRTHVRMYVRSRPLILCVIANNSKPLRTYVRECAYVRTYVR